eukprot:NODE_2617_length_533_cov_150.482759_g2567_i0.p1 GENE.NODE_2617_length_533_cov_150.482759_g2567_i0~~NODE_2617_length_533_cov_150.482759_g2567_i0.p1  ORF type:complete len:126 (+),score=35.37 NODE_2617_length_533_cov_150.482759_g2567_i0:83-460(+)
MKVILLVLAFCLIASASVTTGPPTPSMNCDKAIAGHSMAWTKCFRGVGTCERKVKPGSLCKDLAGCYGELKKCVDAAGCQKCDSYLSALCKYTWKNNTACKSSQVCANSADIDEPAFGISHLMKH